MAWLLDCCTGHFERSVQRAEAGVEAFVHACFLHFDITMCIRVKVDTCLFVKMKTDLGTTLFCLFFVDQYRLSSRKEPSENQNQHMLIGVENCVDVRTRVDDGRYVTMVTCW